MHFSESKSLNFWESFSLRVGEELAKCEHQLAQLTAPLETSVESALKNLKRSEQARAESVQLLSRIETLQLLLLGLAVQRDIARHAQGFPVLEHKIESMRALIRIFEPYAAQTSSRLQVEEDLLDVLNRNEDLKRLGSGEQASIDRQAIRQLSISLPVLGKEDVKDYALMIRQLHVGLDQHEAELQALKAETKYALNVVPDLIPLLQELGVSLAPVSAENTSSPPTADAHQS